MTTGLESLSSSFNSDELNIRVIEVRLKHSDGIRSPSCARVNAGRQPSSSLEYLISRFISDDSLESRHHFGERVGTTCSSENIVRRFHAR